MQVLSYSILPQILPSFAGVSIFRWDINIREATVIGLVGAGAIGLNLNSAVNSLRWKTAGTPPAIASWNRIVGVVSSLGPTRYLRYVLYGRLLPNHDRRQPEQ